MFLPVYLLYILPAVSCRTVFPGAGEGTRTLTVAHRILSPARLPVPPLPHTSSFALFTLQ